MDGSLLLLPFYQILVGCSDLVVGIYHLQVILLAEVMGCEFFQTCLLYTSDAADERSSVDLGGRRIIKKKKQEERHDGRRLTEKKLRLQHTNGHATN